MDTQAPVPAIETIEQFQAWLGSLDLPNKERHEIDSFVFVVGVTCNGQLPALLRAATGFTKALLAKMEAEKTWNTQKKILANLYAKPIWGAGLLESFDMAQLCRRPNL